MPCYMFTLKLYLKLKLHQCLHLTWLAQTTRQDTYNETFMTLLQAIGMVLVWYLNLSQFAIPWYIWFYTQDRLFSQTGYSKDIQVHYQTTDRSMSFISGYDIDIQVQRIYTRVQQKAGSTFSQKIKTIRCDTILQCDTVYCLSSTWVCRHPVYSYNIKIFFLQSSYINSFLHFDSRHFHTFHHHHRSFITPS